MRLRFWEPKGASPQSFRPGPAQLLPARRINLTELDWYGQQMALAVGLQAHEHQLVQASQGFPPKVAPIEASQLVDMLPEQLARVTLVANNGTMPGLPEGIDPHAWVQTQGSFPKTLTLALNDGLDTPAHLYPQNVPDDAVANLVRTWSDLGRPRPTWSWVFPTLFLLGIAVSVAPLVVLWIRGDISRWLILPTTALVAMAFFVVAPNLQARVAEQRQRRAGLDLDFRLLRTVRTDRAIARQNLQSGLLGALAGALVAAVGVWATLKAGGSPNGKG